MGSGRNDRIPSVGEAKRKSLPPDQGAGPFQQGAQAFRARRRGGPASVQRGMDAVRDHVLELVVLLFVFEPFAWNRRTTMQSPFFRSRAGIKRLRASRLLQAASGLDFRPARDIFMVS